MRNFRARNTNVFNICALQSYIFRYLLRHFATKPCRFTNFKILFSVVVKDFVYLVYIKIKSIKEINVNS